MSSGDILAGPKACKLSSFIRLISIFREKKLICDKNVFFVRRLADR